MLVELLLVLLLVEIVGLDTKLLYGWKLGDELLLFNTIKRIVPVIAAIVKATIKMAKGFLYYQNIFKRYYVVKPTALGAYIFKN